MRRLATIALLGAFALTLTASVWATPVRDWVPPNGYIVFWWTEDGAAITLPDVRHNNSDEGKVENFGEPPANATDWCQWTEDAEGNRSQVWTVQLAKNTSDEWEYEPLSNAPEVPWRIPDLIDPGLIIDPINLDPNDPNYPSIYAFVNLRLYTESNPWPLLTPGDTVSVVNGEIPGLEGIAWGTTPFTYDPTSELGYVTDAPYTGDATLQNFHDNVPEPATAMLLAAGVAGVAFRRRRRSG